MSAHAHGEARSVRLNWGSGSRSGSEGSEGDSETGSVGVFRRILQHNPTKKKKLIRQKHLDLEGGGQLDSLFIYRTKATYNFCFSLLLFELCLPSSLLLCLTSLFCLLGTLLQFIFGRPFWFASLHGPVVQWIRKATEGLD